MKMRIDPAKSVQQNLIALLNTKAKRPVGDADFSFGTPTVITPGAGNNNSNTQLVATYQGSAGYTGQTTIQYNRNTLKTTYPQALSSMAVTGADTTTSIKTKIASALKAIASELDLIEYNGLPDGGKSNKGVVADAVVGSKLYAPGKKAFKLANGGAPAAIADNLLISGGLKANGSTDIRNLRTGTAFTVTGDLKISSLVRKYESNVLAFDGVGDRATLPISEVGNLQSGDFTIEAWVFPLLLSGVRPFVAQCSQVSGVVNNSWYFGANGTALDLFFGPNSIAGSLLSGGTLVVNKWQHVAVTRQGNVFRSFINGVQVSTATFAGVGTAQPALPLQLGNYYSSSGTFPATGVNDYNGYMDQLSIRQGVALYTANFTPSRRYDPQRDEFFTYGATELYSRHSLLITADNLASGSVDIRNQVTGTAGVITGSLAVSTAQKKYGTGSLSLPAGTARMVIPFADVPSVLSGDFTIEAWVYPTDITGYRVVLAQWQQTTGGGGFSLAINAGKPYFAFGAFNENAGLVVGANNIIANQWQHMAVTRSGDVFRLYVDGVEVANATSATQRAPLSINYVVGNLYGPSGTLPGSGISDYAGFIDEIAITPGKAKYTAAFTPESVVITL